MEELLNYEKNMEQVIKTLRENSTQNINNSEERVAHKLDGQAAIINKVEQEMDSKIEHLQD